MRVCSRCVAGAISPAFGGSGRLTCVVPMRVISAQPTSNANSAGAISRRAGNPDARMGSKVTTSASVVYDLDLLGTRRLHPGPAPLFDPSAHAHAPAGQRLRLKSGGRESAFFALGD